MTLLKKNDTARKLRSLKKHLILILQPFLVAFGTVISWLWLYDREIHFSSEDEGILIGAVITTLALAFGITATVILSTVWEKYRKIVSSVMQHEKMAFLRYRDERMPIMLHLFIGSLSLPLLTMIMLLDYKSAISGAVSVFFISFMITLYWIVLAQLENPAKSAWLSERVPKEWLDADIDEIFALERQTLEGAEKTGIAGNVSAGVLIKA